MQFKARTVTINGFRYILQEDVVELLREAAASETTDVKKRLEQLAVNVLKASVTEN